MVQRFCADCRYSGCVAVTSASTRAPLCMPAKRGKVVSSRSTASKLRRGATTVWAWLNVKYGAGGQVREQAKRVKGAWGRDDTLPAEHQSTKTTSPLGEADLEAHAQERFATLSGRSTRTSQPFCSGQGVRA